MLVTQQIANTFIDSKTVEFIMGLYSKTKGKKKHSYLKAIA